MRSTLFYIPHADPIFDLPLFGFGWIVALLVVGSVIWLGMRIMRHGWSWELLSELPLLLLLGAAVVWGAPLVEERSASGAAVGIPIRGYGLLVLTGIVSSVGLLVYESRRMGLHPDLMMSLAFWMVVGGFAGARIFYVIEYWPQFAADSIPATLANIAKLTDGGLVVYGSFIGASITVLIFVGQHKLPLLAIADLLAPCLMLGVAFGRLGCFMNGCCWGGTCEPSALAVTFPQGSPPYFAQIEDGSLLGMEFEPHQDRSYTVASVQPGGLGERAGLKRGDQIAQIVLPPASVVNRLRHGEAVPDALLTLQLEDGRRISWQLDQLPARSATVHPAQVYSSINAALICLFLWSYYPYRRRDGEVTALLMTIYPIARFLLEMIRTDEAGLFRFDFRLTISQTISLVLMAGVIALWCYVLSRPKGSALPLATQGARV